jgi:hypothetical protein
MWMGVSAVNNDNLLISESYQPEASNACRTIPPCKRLKNEEPPPASAELDRRFKSVAALDLAALMFAAGEKQTQQANLQPEP